MGKTWRSRTLKSVCECGFGVDAQRSEPENVGVRGHERQNNCVLSYNFHWLERPKINPLKVPLLAMKQYNTIYYSALQLTRSSSHWMMTHMTCAPASNAMNVMPSSIFYNRCHTLGLRSVSVRLDSRTRPLSSHTPPRSTMSLSFNDTATTTCYICNAAFPQCTLKRHTSQLLDVQ